MGENLIAQLLKFCVVGGSGVFVDFGVTYLVKETLRQNRYLANSLGFMIAATSNYLLNRWWTFQSDNPEVTVEYLKFLTIAAIGLIFNNALLYVAHEKFKINFYLSKIGAIGVVTIWNFGMNYLFTFQ